MIRHDGARVRHVFGLLCSVFETPADGNGLQTGEHDSRPPQRAFRCTSLRNVMLNVSNRPSTFGPDWRAFVCYDRRADKPGP
jgi:hypothetical protein